MRKLVNTMTLRLSAVFGCLFLAGSVQAAPTLVIDDTDTSGAAVSNAFRNASQNGGVGFGIGQTFTTVDATNISSVTLVKGDNAQAYNAGNSLRFTLFAWNPTDEATNHTSWVLGDGHGDGDPLNGTGMTLLFSNDFEVAVGTYNQEASIRFNLDTNITLAASTAYGFTSEFIFGAVGGANNMNFSRQNNLEGDKYLDGDQIQTRVARPSSKRFSHLSDCYLSIILSILAIK